MTSGIAAAEDYKELLPTEVDKDARKALIGSALGYAMDGFDLLILGFMLRVISADLHLTAAQGASLVTATLIGAVIGGIGFGMLSDRIGRVRVLTYTIVLFAVFTGMCGLAQGYYDLLSYRFIAGVGLGGEFGIGMALVAEPEVFVANVKDKPKESALRLLVKDTETTKLSIGMIILCSVQNFGYYGVMIWLPSYLSTRFGFALTQSAVWTSVTIAGMAVGIYCFGHIADRIGRRPAFFGYMLGSAIMVVVYSRLTDPFALLVAGAVMGFFVNGMLGGYGALISELFPTSARATAQNVLFNIGRAVGGFGPVVVGLVAATYSFEVAIAMLAALYVLDIVAMWFLIPERRGAQLA
jgi:MFS family permease